MNLKRWIAVVVLVGYALAAGAARAAPPVAGDSDLGYGGYGTNGIVLGDAFPGQAYTAVGLPDGRVVAVGYTVVANSDFVVARYTAAGALDPSFGGGDGIATVDFFGGVDYAFAVAVQSDGRILVAGSTEGSGALDRDFAVARLMNDGSPDNSFGGDGEANYDFNQRDDTVLDMALTSDDKLVLAGWVSAYCLTPPCNINFGVLRLNLSNGGPDLPFGGGDARAETDFGGADYGQAMALNPGGQIAMVGASGAQHAVAVYTNTGEPYDYFSGDGKLTGATPSFLTGVAWLPTGLAAVGQVGNDFGVLQLTSSGSPDSSFGGGDGVATVNLGGNDYPQAVWRAGQHALMVAGPSGAGFGLVRLQDTGSPDPDFNGVGYKVMPFAGVNSVVVSRLMPAGNSLAWTLGFATSGTVTSLAMTRVYLDGEADLGGRVSADFGLYRDTASFGAFRPDGKLILVGEADDALGLAQYDVNGDFDSSFSGDGRLAYDPVPMQYVHGAALMPDGRLVVLASTVISSSYYPVVARLNPNGTPDVTLNHIGYKVVDFAGQPGEPEVLAVTPNGQIIVVAYSEGYVHRLTRLHSNGEVDETFGDQGVAEASFGTAYFQAAALQPDGKLLVAGYKETGATDFLLARFTRAGDLDLSFDEDGWTTTDFGAHETAWDVKVQLDGRIVATGNTITGMAVSRYLPYGTLDPSFSGDGRQVIDNNAQANAVAFYGVDILLGGCASGNERHAIVARLTLNGELDPTFGTGGQRVFPNGLDHCLHDLAVYGYKIAAIGEVGLRFAGAEMDFLALLLEGGLMQPWRQVWLPAVAR